MNRKGRILALYILYILFVRGIVKKYFKIEKRREMKYLRQFAIIIGISLIGEVLRYVIPLPIPASIYGLVIMLVLLGTKVLSLESVKDAGLFLVEIMPVMFIPAAVALMTSWKDLQPILLPFSVITVVVTVIVMVCAGHTAQYFIRREKKKQKGKEE